MTDPNQTEPIEKGLIVLVCGGRDYDNPDSVEEILSRLEPGIVITGGAQGADSFAAWWAYYNGHPLAVMKANWEKHGKAAGPIRNAAMLKLKPDLVVAFPGGRGTADMVRRARKAGVRVVEVPR